MALTTGNYQVVYNPNILTILPAPNPVVPFVQIDPLGRPIISVANQAIVLDEPFEQIETLEMNTDVSIASAGVPTGQPEVLAGISPAAGESSDLEDIEPAAGGNDQEEDQAGEGDEFANDLACANNFLDNKPCEEQPQ